MSENWKCITPPTQSFAGLPVCAQLNDLRAMVPTGMILHIEPGCIEKDGIYVLEEQVLVTESGSKVLS